MLIGRSRIGYPTTAKVDIFRKLPEQVGGRIVFGEPFAIYQEVPARVGFMLKEDRNLGVPTGAGMASANEFHVGLGGNFCPSNIQKGDFVRIYWGTKPNLVSDHGIPQGFGPHIQLSTPDGLQTLIWDDDVLGWVNDDYSLAYDESWELSSGDTSVATFGDEFAYPNLRCSSFPTGYKFVRVSGPPMDCQILKLDHKEDDLGRWHHTLLYVEIQDVEG
jgi:hypothetical protein